MKLQIVAIKDSAVSAFNTPSFVQHVGVAVRSFTQAVNDPQHDFFRTPADFELYHLGEYDDQDGSIIQPDTPTRLVRGVDVKTQA